MFIPKAITLKNGSTCIIREAEAEDAARLLEMACGVFASSEHLLTTPEEFTISTEEEKDWILNFKNNPNGLLLIAEQEGRILGNIDFQTVPYKRMAHTGELSMGIAKPFRNLGLGRALLENFMHWAKQHPKIEIVTLQVFANNVPANRLYKTMGFIPEGVRRNAVKLGDGVYEDIIFMACPVA